MWDYPCINANEYNATMPCRLGHSTMVQQHVYLPLPHIP